MKGNKKEILQGQFAPGQTQPQVKQNSTKDKQNREEMTLNLGVFRLCIYDKALGKLKTQNYTHLLHLFAWFRDHSFNFKR